jgi:biopolymer transport protein ExbB/TolQ
MPFRKIHGVIIGLLACDIAYAWAYFSYMVSEQTAWMMVLLNVLFGFLLVLKSKKRPRKTFTFEEKLKEIEREERKEATEEEKHAEHGKKKAPEEKPEKKHAEKEAEYEEAKAEIEQAIKEAEFRYMKRKIDEVTFRDLVKEYNRELVRLEARHKLAKK